VSETERKRAEVDILLKLTSPHQRLPDSLDFHSASYKCVAADRPYLDRFYAKLSPTHHNASERARVEWASALVALIL